MTGRPSLIECEILAAATNWQVAGDRRPIRRKSTRVRRAA